MVDLSASLRAGTSPAQTPELLLIFLKRLRRFSAAWGAGSCRPSVFRDENREPTGKYSRRVGAALHSSKPCTQATARISERGLSLRTIMPVPNVNNHESPRILNHSAMNLFLFSAPITGILNACRAGVTFIIAWLSELTLAVSSSINPRHAETIAPRRTG